MDSLRRRYKELRLREIEIKKELVEGNRMPKLEVLQWLDAVDDVKTQVKQLEKSLAYKIHGCFSLDGSIYSILTRKLSKEVKRLLKRSQFPTGVYPPVMIRMLVEQCPSRSQLFGTIWGNLMDPNVGIMGIYGGRELGKTTAMMSISKKLTTSDMFGSIFWVTVSKGLYMDQRVYQLQADLAQQMKLDLPESGRAVILLNALKKFYSFLIVIDGLCEALPLMMVGIPEPDRENHFKVVLISQDYSVCHIMNSDKIIKMETFSSTEKWDLFASKAGDVVHAPEISIAAEDVLESVLCPKRPQLLDTIWDNMMDPQVRILSIYGEWGVGKTTAMMKIKKQLAGITDSFDSIIWVTFSMGSGLYQLQTDIALQIKLTLPEIGRSVKLLRGLEKIEKFLIIIDDVSVLIPLIKVGIPVPSRNNRYKIVLISRDIEVCTLMKSDKIIKLDTFSLTEKWDLFVSKADNVVINPDIQSLARELVDLCPGRPLIINAISHAMRDEVSLQVWRNTVVHLMGFEAEGLVFELLRICYECLKDDMVQKCFLYCAIFPEDYLFNPEELIRYWMAESFILDADIITKRDSGFKIMTKLLDASMLEMSAKGEDDWLKMPYLCRVLAIRILKEEHDVDVYAGLGMEKMPYNAGMGMEGKVSLMRNQIEVLEVLPFSFNNASTLLFHENPISHIHPSFFTPMLALQFLDLSYTWISELPSTVSELTQLRALFLHYCSNLEIVPSLRKLTKLQVLSLSGTSIADLPQGMEGLVSLRSLDLTDTQKLCHIRVGTISALSHLEELRLHGSGLCKFDSPMVTNYLREMRCLKRLAILTINTCCYGDVLETVMCLQEHKLKMFSIEVYGSTEDCDEDV